jgi:hypothetical protein
MDLIDNDKCYFKASCYDGKITQLQQGETPETSPVPNQNNHQYDAFTQLQQAASHAATSHHNNRPEPTRAQALAGNYAKAKFTLHGLPLVLENVRNSVRTGTGEDGTQWANRMDAHYGEIAGTKGADGDPVDVFVGLFPESRAVWVINQGYPDGGFDEHKLMLGFASEEQARNAYLGSFDRGWTGLLSMVPATIDQIKWWLKHGNMSRQFSTDQLPFDGQPAMNKTLWNADAQPVTTPLHKLMYDIRTDDRAGLMLDAVSMADIMADPDVERVGLLDALVVEVNRLTQKMDVLQRTMETAGGEVKPTGYQISDPIKARGVMQVAVLFTLSDGQTVTVWFHNPDTTPAKLMPLDELISWRWQLNKKDITVVVAPERGRDLNVREVARRIMRLAERNSAAFLKANTKLAERIATEAALDTEIGELTTRLASVQDKIQTAKLRAEEAALLPDPAKETEIDVTTPEGYRHVWADGGSDYLKDRHQDELDSMFNGRLIEVRNALRDLGWEGEKFKSLGRNGAVLVHELEKTTSGINIVGIIYKLDGNIKPSSTYGTDGLRDDLAHTPAELAAMLDADVAKEAATPPDAPVAKYATGQRVTFKPYPFASGEKGAQVADGEVTRVQSFEESTTSGMTGAKSSKILFSYTIQLDSGLIREQIDEEYIIGLAVGATAAPVDALLHSFPGEDGMRADVRSRPDGKFSAILVDVDSGNNVGITIYPTEDAAVAGAKKLVEKSAEPAPQPKPSIADRLQDPIANKAWELTTEEVRSLTEDQYGPILVALENAGLDKEQSQLIGKRDKPVLLSEEALAATGEKFRYGLMNRPLSIGTAPKGNAGFEDAPADHKEYARHGIVIYDRRLTPAEVSQFELAPIIDGDDARNGVADAFVQSLGEYATNYAQMSREKAGSDVADMLKYPFSRWSKEVYGGPVSAGAWPEMAGRILGALEAAYPAAVAPDPTNTQEGAPVDDSQQAPEQVPAQIRSRVSTALEKLRKIREDIDAAVALDTKLGGRGRYESDALENRKTEIAGPQQTLATFRKHAAEKGIDVEALIAELGGEPDMSPSANALAWQQAPAPAEPTPEPAVDPTLAADRAYLESLIDGSGDLLAEDTFTRLEPMFTTYEGNADMMALLEKAATVYGDAAVAAAQSALAPA